MQKITDENFAMICFLVLMQNGAGIYDKSPDYIREKTPMIGEGLNAFAFLDINNMEKASAWCSRWGVELPEKIQKELTLQQEARESLQEKGIYL